MIDTITDERGRIFLMLDAFASRSVSDVHSHDEAQWCVEVSDAASPLAGLYAFGETLGSARDTLAVLAWTAVAAGELWMFGIRAEDVAGIDVRVTTSAKYDASSLADRMEGAA